MKTVIFVWTLDWKHNVYNDKECFFGIGDIVRGMISTYEVCKKYEFTFYIDFQKHPISQYIYNPINPYTKLISIDDTPVQFISRDDDLEKYIIEHIGKAPLFLMSNNNYKNICPEFQKYLCKIFQDMTPKFRLFYDNIKCNLKLRDNYSILHFRLGDHYMVHNNILYTDNEIEKYKLLYEQHKDENQLTISDNKPFKDVLFSQYNAKMLDIEHIGHIGLTDHKKYLRYTLVEFLLVFHSSKIDTYSIYPWTSGFVTIPAILKDIPINTLSL